MAEVPDLNILWMCAMLGSHVDGFEVCWLLEAMPYTFVDSTNFSFFSEGGGSRFL
jgi:hypothetical protein